MKTIKGHDLTKVPAEKIERGMILAEGIVRDVRLESDAYFIDFVGGAVGYLNLGKEANVFAKVTPELFDAITFAEDLFIT